MEEKSKETSKIPRLVPRFEVKNKKLDYSLVKLYIPKIQKGNKKIPTLSKPWYIYFYYRNPATGLFDGKSKFNKKHGINSYKTIAGRKEAARHLIAAYSTLLEEGYNPFNQTTPQKSFVSFVQDNKTIKEAFLAAVKDKSLSWASSTAADIGQRINNFLEFAEKHHFANLESTQLKRIHITEFLKHVSRRGSSGTQVNNYRSALSTVAAQIVENGDLEFNFVPGVKKVKQNPIKNHPYTNGQMQDIKKYLLANDPYLLEFIRVLGYSFLRNREVLHLQVKNIDLKNRMITDKTKAKALEKIFIVDQLHEYFTGLDLMRLKSEDYIFTGKNTPGSWAATEKVKTRVFSARFKKVKEALNLGSEYTLYSFRHTFALHIFANFRSGGLSEAGAMEKMLPITRHESTKALKNYLREIKTMLPPDYSDTITLEF